MVIVGSLFEGGEFDVRNAGDLKFLHQKAANFIQELLTEAAPELLLR
jgi:hypothetical protein